MVTLASLDGGSLVGDTVGEFQRGRVVGQDIRSQLLTPGLAERVQGGDEAALRELAILNPTALQNVLNAPALQESNQTKVLIDQTRQAQAEVIRLQANVKQAIGDGDPAKVSANLLNLLQTRQGEEGFDAQQVADLLKIAQTDPDEALNQLRVGQTANQAELEIADRILGTLGGQVKLQKGQGVVTRIDGVDSIVTPVFNPKTGKVENVVTQLEGQILTREGETPQEKSTRLALQKGAEERAKLQEQLTTKPKIKAAEAKESRESALIERGTTAAESTATIRRAISLLDKVKTGGPQAISLAIKQRLGIEGADEGELSNSLGKAVLSQLRETFGAAFTESEGLRLERIEANFGKSAATNRRLLGQALKIAERTAGRARKVALAKGQDDVVADIDELLAFTLTDEEPVARLPAGVAEEDIQFTMQQNKLTREEVLSRIK